MLKLNKV